LLCRVAVSRPLTTLRLRLILAARDKFPLWDSNGNRV
jgi:hypothetical protein